jgi:hypothetical protein
VARKPARHDYWSCRDRECQRLACEAYRSGYDDGYRDAAASQED